MEHTEVYHPMNIAIVGAGAMGRLRAEAAAGTPGFSLTAVVDPDLAAAEQAAGGQAAVHAKAAPVLADPGIDVIVISSPVQHHEEIALAALAAGKHVLCEKPLSNTAASCRRILEQVERSSGQLAVGFNFRYYPSFRYVKEVVDSGILGRLDHLRIFGGHDGLANFRADWMYKSSFSGGGSMMDIGLHMTDLTRYLFGEIAEVSGVTTGDVWNVPGSEDNALCVFTNEAGVPAIYQATWTEWKGFRCFVEAYGDRGMVRGSYGPMLNFLITQDKPGAATKRSFKLYPGHVIREKLRGWQSTTLNTFKEELLDFRARVLEGADVPLADGRDGLRAVEIGESVRSLRRTGDD